MRQLLATALMASMTFGPLTNSVMASDAPRASQIRTNVVTTATPIKHLVIIFMENISFDHYFGTYPYATNPQGEPPFHPAAGTPTVNGLVGTLTTYNPNLNPVNGTGATNPFRLDRSQAATADQDHNYTPEQQAFDGGLMDLFPLYTGVAGPPPNSPPPQVDTNGLVMGYYDGNTVTALWNYAQNYALNDNSYDTNFGPSTPGALNLVSGQTNGVIQDINGGSVISDGNGGFTLYGDADPVGDMCSTTTGALVQMGGKNIGDLLNAAGVTWGFFSGGFNLSITNSNGTTGCHRSTTSAVTNTTKADYIPHHQPFQYYTSTANPTHLRPTSVAMIGYQDQANHQYDSLDFVTAVSAGNFPAVSFLKAPGYQDAHAGYSDPLDEQTYIVDTVNFLMSRPEWSSTAVVIAYDDSDGWYDHQLGQIVNTSQTAADHLNGQGFCGTGVTALPGINPATLHAQGRCGYGPRMPLLVISPYTKANSVDHTMTDQSSIIRFVEDNWLGGQRIGGGSFDAIANPITSMFTWLLPSTCYRTLILDDQTGLVTQKGCAP